jgi:hypothetical protein
MSVSSCRMCDWWTEPTAAPGGCFVTIDRRPPPSGAITPVRRRPTVDVGAALLRRQIPQVHLAPVSLTAPLGVPAIALRLHSRRRGASGRRRHFPLDARGSTGRIQHLEQSLVDELGSRRIIATRDPFPKKGRGSLDVESLPTHAFHCNVSRVPGTSQNLTYGVSSPPSGHNAERIWALPGRQADAR